MAGLLGLAVLVGVLFCALICLTLVAMSATLRKILREIRVMAKTGTDLENDLTGIKADLDAISSNVASTVQAQQTTIDGLKTQVAELQAQVAAGTAVTQTQLDGLVTIADTIKAQADGLLASLPAAAPAEPPAVAPAAPEPIL